MTQRPDGNSEVEHDSQVRNQSTDREVREISYSRIISRYLGRYSVFCIKKIQREVHNAEYYLCTEYGGNHVFCANRRPTPPKVIAVTEDHY